MCVKKVTLSLFAFSVLLFAVMRRSPARQVDPVADGPGLSVVTLNMAKNTAIDRILQEFHGISALKDADILLLQEVKQDHGARQCAAEQLAASLGLHVAYSPATTGVTDQGLAILSRYPLRDVDVQPLKRFDLRYRSRVRIALGATADSPWGPVRIFNAHLDTRLNTPQRLEQLEPVLQAGGSFHGPLIVGGDFNSNRFYWVEHVLPLPVWRSQAYGVRDFMVRNGFLTPIRTGETTFDYLGMHLDWIWLRGLNSQVSRVYPLDFSDHHAVWTRVQFPPA
jgi:endonuclease/exonuclease/phosphatase family metal-dependent hydrolase